MEHKTEYLQLLELYARVVESMRGVKLTEESSWLAETQPLAVKLFYHLGSMYFLTKGTSLPPLTGVKIRYVDYPSVVVLTRAAFETYLTFYFVFVAPRTVEEKRFRYGIWDLGGLLDRQEFPATDEENKRKLKEEKRDVDKLLEEIKQSSFYSRLNRDQKKSARKGGWRLGHSWVELAEMAGFDKNYFKPIYRYLCSYAHTGNLSITQLSQAKDRKILPELVKAWLGTGLVLMGHFIFAYVSIYPKAESVLSEFREAARIADIWNSIGRQRIKEDKGG
jgi:hypothetical protein